MKQLCSCKCRADDAPDSSVRNRAGLDDLPQPGVTPHCLPIRGLTLARLDKADVSALGFMPLRRRVQRKRADQHAHLMELYLSCLTELKRAQVRCCWCLVQGRACMQ